MLEARFGDDQVTVEYVDVDDPEIENYPQAEEILTSGKAPAPLVAIDDEIKWAGSIPVYYIVEDLKKRGLQEI